MIHIYIYIYVHTSTYMYYRSIFCSYLLASFVSCLYLVQAYQFHIADQIAHQLMQPLDSTSASGLHWIVRWQTNYTNWVKSFCSNYTWYHDISMTSPWPLLGSLTNTFSVLPAVWQGHNGIRHFRSGDYGNGPPYPIEGLSLSNSPLWLCHCWRIALGQSALSFNLGNLAL